MSHLHGYARGTRTRAALATALSVALWLYDAFDALASAIVGVPSVTRSAGRRISVTYLAVRRAYLVHRYGPASGCTGVEAHIAEGVIVDKEAGR